MGDAEAATADAAADEVADARHVHEMDTSESEEDACSWRALQECLASVGDPPVRRARSASSDAPAQKPLPFVDADAVPASWGLHVSGAVHGGWVKQHSPACAAAVVAGAWNALACGGDRHALGALRQEHVVAHLTDVLREAIASKRARFERMLGAPVSDFIEALMDAVAADPSGKTLGGKSKAEPGMSRREVMRIALTLVESRGEPELRDRESRAAAAAAASAPAEDATDRTGRRSAEETHVSRSESPADPTIHHATMQTNESSLDDVDTTGESRPAPMSSFGALAALAREDAARRAASFDDDDDDGASDDSRDSYSEPDSENEPDSSNDENDENGLGSVSNASAVGDEPSEEDLVAALAAGIPGFGGGVEKMKTKSVNSKKMKKKKAPPPGLLARLSRAAPSSSAAPNDAAPTTDRPRRTEPVWRWRKDLWEILRKMAGLEKLRRPKPSTAAFGNWGVAEAFRRCVYFLFFVWAIRLTSCFVYRVSAAAQPADPAAPPAPRVSCRVVVGAKTRLRKDLPVPLTRNASEEAIDGEWRRLCALFATDGSALIFHLKNHYALVHALRERTDRDGRRTREMLTARRGQRPNAWIPWEEARSTMLRWSGYAIMQATRHAE